MKIKFDSANILTDKEYIKNQSIIPVIPETVNNPRWWIKPDKLKKAKDVLYINDYKESYTMVRNENETKYTRSRLKINSIKTIHLGSLENDYGIRPIIRINRKDFKKLKKEYKQEHKKKLLPGKQCTINGMKFTLLKDKWFIPFFNKHSTLILNNIYTHHAFRYYLYALYNNKNLSVTKELRERKLEYQKKYQEHWNVEYQKTFGNSWYDDLQKINFDYDSWEHVMVNNYEDSCIKRIIDVWFNQNFNNEVEIIF